MKKKILIIVLSVVLVAGLGVGIAALCGAFNGGDSSSTSVSESQSSSFEENSSSTPEEVVLPNVAKRVDVSTALSKNFKSINLKDFYMLCKGDTRIVGKLFKGVTLGDLALHALGSNLNFNYYDDGKWYSSNADGKLDDFNLVLAAIFEYQIGSEEPLALSEMQLEICGDAAVITYFESQFGISISTLINNPPAELSALLPDGIRSFLSRCIAFTVRDLYDLTTGDFTYVREFIENTDVDEITNLVFDLLERNSDQNYVKIRALLIKILNGNLPEIIVDDTVTVYSVVEAYFENTTEYTDFEWELKTQLMAIYGNKTTLGELKNKTLELDVDLVIKNLSTLIKTLVSEDEKQTVEEVANALVEILSGTLGNILINVNAQQVEEFIENTLGITVINCEEAKTFLTDLSNSIAELICGSVQAFKDFVNNYENLTLAEIDGYFNGAISQKVINAGYEWDGISTLTIANIKSIINEIFSIEDGEFEELLNDIENANGDFKEIITIINNTLNEWLEEKKNLTLKDLLEDYITVESEIGELTLSEILNKKLFSLDDILFDGELYSLTKGTGTETLLIDLSMKDLFSIAVLNASEETVCVLDAVDMVEFLDLLTNVNEQQIAK